MGTDGEERLTDLVGHIQRMPGRLLDVEPPQDARNGDEQRIFGEMDPLTEPSPEAVVEVVALHVARGKGGGVRVGVVAEEAGGVEGVGIAVAVAVPVEGHEVGYDDGSFADEMAVVKRVFCEAVGDAYGLELVFAVSGFFWGGAVLT